MNECGNASCGCQGRVSMVPWDRERLPETRTISVRIGQSGGKKGYAGITGMYSYAQTFLHACMSDNKGGT